MFVRVGSCSIHIHHMTRYAAVISLAALPRQCFFRSHPTRRLIACIRTRFSDLHVNSILPLCRPREQTSSPPKGRVGITVGVRSGVGLLWAPQPSFSADTLHIGSRHIHKSLMNLRANPNSLGTRVQLRGGCGHPASQILDYCRY